MIKNNDDNNIYVHHISYGINAAEIARQWMIFKENIEKNSPFKVQLAPKSMHTDLCFLSTTSTATYYLENLVFEGLPKAIFANPDSDAFSELKILEHELQDKPALIYNPDKHTIADFCHIAQIKRKLDLSDLNLFGESSDELSKITPQYHIFRPKLPSAIKSFDWDSFEIEDQEIRPDIKEFYQQLTETNPKIQIPNNKIDNALKIASSLLDFAQQSNPSAIAIGTKYLPHDTPITLALFALLQNNIIALPEVDIALLFSALTLKLLDPKQTPFIANLIKTSDLTYDLHYITSPNNLKNPTITEPITPHNSTLPTLDFDLIGNLNNLGDITLYRIDPSFESTFATTATLSQHTPDKLSLTLNQPLNQNLKNPIAFISNNHINLLKLFSSITSLKLITNE